MRATGSDVNRKTRGEREECEKWREIEHDWRQVTPPSNIISYILFWYNSTLLEIEIANYDNKKEIYEEKKLEKMNQRKFNILCK